MANILGIASFQLEDYTGVRASQDQYLLIPDTVTVAQLGSYIASLGAVLDPITGAKGRGATVSLKFTTTGLKTSPVAGISVERTILSTWNKTGSNYPESIDVPAVAAGALDAAGAPNMVSGSPLGPWSAFLLTPTNGIVVADKLLNVLPSIRDWAVTFRKHRRALSRRANKVNTLA